MITILETPVKVSPVYNPIYTKVSSNQTTQEGFNFLFDLYVNGIFVTRTNLLPRPGTTQTIYSPARILESYVNYDLTQNVVDFTPNTNCMAKYKIVYGEEYVLYWYYDSINKDTITSTSYTILTSTTKHNYIVDDDIIITQDPGFTYAKYNGIHKVVTVIDDYNILINVNWDDAGTTLAEPGTTTWADKRKTVFFGDDIVMVDGSNYTYTAEWYGYGPDGCGVTLKCIADNSLTLTVPDVSCGTALQVIDYYGPITFISGRTYKISYTITANDPSGNGWNLYSSLGGNSTVHNFDGPKEDIVVCGGFGSQLRFGFNLTNADTGGFGAHSLKVTDLTIEMLPEPFEAYAFNGVIQYNEVPNWNYLDFQMGGAGTGRFLTKRPTILVTDLGERGSMSLLNSEGYTSAVEYYLNITITDTAGMLTGYNYEIIPMEASMTQANSIIHFAAFPWNINELSVANGDGYILDTTTDTYQLQIVIVDGINPPFTAISERKIFQVRENCSRFEPVRFMFLNSLGEFDYYTATLASRTNINVSRDNYTKTLEYLYEVGDRGKTTINLNAQESYSVYTDWISETTAEWLSYELFLSREVYILDYNTGQITPVILDNNSIEVKKRVLDKLINYQFNYTKAVPVNTTRG